MPVTNLVEAVLGRDQLKWDALWRLFAWLLDPEEGHGLGTQIRDQLEIYTFGRTFPVCSMKREYQLSRVRDGKGKWADLALAMPSFEAPAALVVMDDVDFRSPGGRRKIDNLKLYQRLARGLFIDSSTIIRALVLTNARTSDYLYPLYDHLGPEAADFQVANGWKLLSLKTVGEWVATALASAPGERTDKMSAFLADFVEWTASLDLRPLKTAHSQQNSVGATRPAIGLAETV